VQEPLRLNVFPSGSNWPVRVAQEKGFLAGRADIASTAIDKVIAYVEGQGEASGSDLSPRLSRGAGLALQPRQSG
jgi:hypothetical protein